MAKAKKPRKAARKTVKKPVKKKPVRKAAKRKPIKRAIKKPVKKAARKIVSRKKTIKKFTRKPVSRKKPIRKRTVLIVRKKKSKKPLVTVRMPVPRSQTKKQAKAKQKKITRRAAKMTAEEMTKLVRFRLTDRELGRLSKDIEKMIKAFESLEKVVKRRKR